MHTILKKLLSLFFALGVCFFSINTPIAFAQNPSLEEIDRLYEESKTIPEYENIASQIEKVLSDQPNLYEWKWRQARVHYALAKKSDDLKIHHYDQCIQISAQAIELQPDSAISYFFRGLCRGKKGELKGVWASLEIIDPFEEDMKKAVSLDPTVVHSGPHRALGKLYLELPFFLGGDLGKAEAHLSEAVRLSPDYAENYLGLAQVQIKKFKSEEALETLHKLLQLTDNTQDEKLLSMRKEGMELLEELSD
ncbi:MAG: TRAP transporter TatT component family protein [Nitrospinota bacterium]